MNKGETIKIKMSEEKIAAINKFMIEGCSAELAEEYVQSCTKDGVVNKDCVAGKIKAIRKAQEEKKKNNEPDVPTGSTGPCI